MWTDIVYSWLLDMSYTFMNALTTLLVLNKCKSQVQICTVKRMIQLNVNSLSNDSVLK